MKKVIIVGASGFGKEVLSLLKLFQDINVIGFIDSRVEIKGERIDGIPVLGDDSFLENLRNEGVEAAVVAIGDYQTRAKLAQHCRELGYQLINVVHPSSKIVNTVKMGEGVIIYGGTVINADVKIGNNVLINSGATIGHDTVVEDNVNINPGVDIGGKVLIKQGAYIGIGSSVIQNIVVGAESLVGAGAVVIRDVPEKLTVAGVPAKVIRRRDQTGLKIIRIGNKKIGEGHPVFIIAEVGVNHNGDIELAKKLIDKAVEANADAVKFQTFKAEKLNTRKAPKAEYHLETTGNEGSWFDLLKSQELDQQTHFILADYCRSKGIIFLSTPYDEDSADMLEKIGVPAYKIASTDLTNILFLKHVARKNKPIFLPTGLCNYQEIEEAIDCIRKEGNNQIVVLQCTANYPAEIKDANLVVMNEIKKRFDVLVGYSDHTPGMVLPIAATAQGSCLHEKHFTLHKELPGPDHRASIDPEELAEMVNLIRVTETCIGQVENKPTESEKNNIFKLRKSVVANIDISLGTIITSEMITAKRPGTGLHPRHIYDFIGKKAVKEIKEDELLDFSMVKTIKEENNEIKN